MLGRVGIRSTDARASSGRSQWGFRQSLLPSAPGTASGALAGGRHEAPIARAATTASCLPLGAPAPRMACQQQCCSGPAARRGGHVACQATAQASEAAISGRNSYRFHSKAGALIDVCVEPGQTKTLVDIRVSYENASWGTPEQLQLHWCVCVAGTRGGPSWHADWLLSAEQPTRSTAHGLLGPEQVALQMDGGAVFNMGWGGKGSQLAL